MTKKYLSQTDISVVANHVLARARARGADYMSWINPPIMGDDGAIRWEKRAEGGGTESVVVDAGEALDIYKRKMDALYTERLLMSLGAAQVLAAQGYDILLVQEAQAGLPFDASGWLTLIVGGPHHRPPLAGRPCRPERRAPRDSRRQGR
ncbi:hypothetical protein CCP2SC5_2450001 [Azospirillaceae bacterium]